MSLRRLREETLRSNYGHWQETHLEVVLQEIGESPAVGRKSAKQSRSKAKVQLILDTTLSMLNAGPADKITTNDIARNANISIGTLYQFFSRKEDIYYELYRQWLAQTLNTLDKIDTRFNGSEGLEAYADAVFDSLSRDETINSRGHWQLRFAMSSSRELAELERRHNQEVFHRIVATQRKFGRKITTEQAHALARLQHNVAVACLSAAAEVDASPEREILLKWCRKTLHLVYDVNKLNS